MNLVRHQIQAEDCLLGGSGEEANPQMASTRSGRIRFNLFAIILKIHRLKSQTKPLLPKQMKNSISQKFQIIILGGLFFRAGENRGWNLIVRKREPARRAQLISA